MAITKGFLRPKYFVLKQRLVTGIILGTFLSYLLYRFFYYFREIFRILAFHFGYGALLELTKGEIWFYNAFYGSVSAILGAYFALTFSIENSTDYTRKKVRLGQRAILNEQRFFQWNFMNAFIRMGSVIGIIFSTIPLHYEMDFLKEFELLLILIPIVLFFSMWPTFLRKVGKQGYKWVIYSLIYVIGLTFIYGNINFSNSEKINQSLLKSDPVYAYHIELPQTRFFSELRNPNLFTNFYLVEDSSFYYKPTLFVHGFHSFIGIEGIRLQVAQEKDGLPESQRNKFIPNLFIDKDVKMGLVKKITSEFNKSHVKTIQYSTNILNSKYPVDRFKYSGIPQDLGPVFSPKFILFLDSIEKLDPKKFKLRLSESTLYRLYQVKNSRFVRLNLSSENITLNGRCVYDDQLKIGLYRFIKTYSPNYNIVFEADDEVSFEKYIQYLDLIYSVVDKLRQEMSFHLYQIPYDDYENYFDPKTDTIRSIYPINIIEWSPEEKRLIEIIKKTGYVL